MGFKSQKTAFTLVQDSKKFQKELDDLISILKLGGFLTEEKVESALRNIPRHEFVPESELNRAYYNEPLLIMNGQTISQPGVVSRMTEWLDVKEGQKILEIGSGSGWQTAILSYLVRDGIVYSIERHPELVEFTKSNLEKLEIKNVHVILDDGSLGYVQKAPYDRIIITAACSKIPKPILDQLTEGGLLVAPVGDSLQSLVLLQKTPNGLVEIKNQPNYVFVPLLGKFGKNNS